MNKKKLSIIITALVAVVAVVAVIGGISINKHNEQKREAQRQEEESKSKALAEELEQAKNDLLAYISDDTYVEDKTTYKDEIQSADNIDRINGIKADYESEVQEIKAEIERKEAARVVALAEKKETGTTLIGGYSRISLDEWNEKIEAAETEEEVDEIVSEAGQEESNAIEAEKAAAEAAKKSSGKKKIASTNGGGNGGGETSSTTPAGGSNSGSSDFELPPGVTLSDPNDWTGWVGGNGGYNPEIDNANSNGF